ncbi:hypothetical protein LEN26_011016 [Aphanomyces euteiches]|nr:hypothetical protein LEN26_011016 [Aphanomyces euteiches]
MMSSIRMKGVIRIAVILYGILTNQFAGRFWKIRRFRKETPTPQDVVILMASTQSLEDANLNIKSSSKTLELSVKKSGVASIGALLTALFVSFNTTSFVVNSWELVGHTRIALEVAKTRLQAQGPPTTILSAKTSTINYCYCTHFQFSNGLMDHMIPKTKSTLIAGVPMPAPNCPVHNPPPVQLRGTIHALSHIVRSEGVSALYSGLPPTLLIAVPSTVFYFTSYDLLLSSAKRQFPDHATIVPFFAGSLARCIAATVVSPLELIRVRMQAAPNAGSFASVLQRSVNDGFFSLWRGLVPTLARDVPFSAIYWGSFEILKSRLTAEASLSTRENPGQTQLAIAFVSGATAGSIATVITQPFDVIKTKQQIETFSSTGVANTAERPSVPRMMREILRTEGFGGLMNGLTARVAKVAPACAIMIATYEAGKQFLGVD